MRITFNYQLSIINYQFFPACRENPGKDFVLFSVFSFFRGRSSA